MHKNAGFSLVEVLVSIAIFCIGAVGVDMYVSRGVNIASNNLIREQQVSLAREAGELLLYHSRHDCLKTVLQNLYPRTMSANNGKSNVVVNLEKVEDGGGATIATNSNGSVNFSQSTSSSWKSPVTVTLSIPYEGAKGVVDLYPSYTVILQDYTQACDD